MSLPSDRPGLLRLLDELEAKLTLLENGDLAADTESALSHALAIYKLAQVRSRLGDRSEAERLFDQAAIEFMDVDTPKARGGAAMARVQQAQSAEKDGRDQEALAIFDQMIAEHEGFPTMEGFPRGPVVPVRRWLRLLGRAGDERRLYEACGVALSSFDLEGRSEEREAAALAVSRRALCAEDLGLPLAEALALYEQAIRLWEDFDSKEPAHTLLNVATAKVFTLRVELGRHEDARDAAHQVIERLGASTDPIWQRVVARARAFLPLTPNDDPLPRNFPENSP